jgi:hypothetical protein
VLTALRFLTFPGTCDPERAEVESPPRRPSWGECSIGRDGTTKSCLIYYIPLLVSCTSLTAGSLKSADPGLWGYRFDGTDESNASLSAFSPIRNDAFQLHLIGKIELDSPLTIPPLLQGDRPIVVVHADTDYLDFYNSISRVVGGFSILADEQDIILPAFKGELYYDRRASASIPAAIIARVRRLDLQTGIPIPS